MSKQSFTFAIMKLIDDTINVNIKDLYIFLELLTAYGKDINNPFIIDASQSILDHFKSDEPLKSNFEQWSNNQVKFK